MPAVQRAPNFYGLVGIRVPACPNPEERSDEVEFGHPPTKWRKFG